MIDANDVLQTYKHVTVVSEVCRAAEKKSQIFKKKIDFFLASEQVISVEKIRYFLKKPKLLYRSGDIKLCLMTWFGIDS